MRFENEVKHKSEDIDEDVLTDAVAALQRRVTVSYVFDIPYIAGYSEDAKTIYIDRHLPRTIPWKGVRVRLAPFLVTHEIVEKALLDELRLHYLHAHQIALRAERDAVKAAGLNWRSYQAVMKAHEKQIDEEVLKRVPRRLDLTPYRDLDDFAVLERLTKAGAT
ncbi:hypothetical protein [Mesorhizobium sp. 131-2-5]|uniref:hypothetical protein n=1 Tax=Mesorhizobium sp. 131-2-5 TaxID=2744519 RepID=UPI00192701FF|nr:hypothetical protein [Mesorhizobium sp. 131-2-5]